MTRKIEELLRQPGPHFIAVGSLHLVGPRSIVEQLKAKGYRVETNLAAAEACFIMRAVFSCAVLTAEAMTLLGFIALYLIASVGIGVYAATQASGTLRTMRWPGVRCRCS